MAIVRETVKEDIEYLYDKLKPADLREIKGLGFNSKTALDDCFYGSNHCCTIVHKNKPIGIFGVSKDGVSEATGRCVGKIGLLTTPEIKDIKVQFLKEANEHINKILKGYDRVYNIVAQDNIISIKFLTYLGFKFLSTCVINNHYYISFYKEL